MTNVFSLEARRNNPSKQKMRKSVFLPFAPLKVQTNEREQVITKIEDLIQRSVKLKNPSHLVTIPRVLDREKAVVDSLNLYEEAIRLAASINCKIVRQEKENEVIYTIKDKV